MSIHFVPKTKRYIIRIRDPEGHNRNITVNTKNLLKYNLPIFNRITERVAKKLEQAILIQEKVFNGSNHSLNSSLVHVNNENVLLFLFCSLFFIFS